MTVSGKHGVLLAGCALALAAAASAEVIEVRQAISKAGVQTDIGETRIVVDGQGMDKYDHVVTKTVDAWVTISGDPPSNGIGPSDGKLRVEGGTVPINTPRQARIYRISFPYRAPKSASVANMRVSPVELCNDRLAKLTGAARTKFLKEGDLFRYSDAWTASASINWQIKDTKGVFKDPPGLKTFAGSAPIGTSIECRPLDRPKVRMTKTTTTTGKTGPRAKKMDPTIKSATLRIEPAKIERIGREMCPTQLALYGQVVTIRPFRGSAIMLGQGYLSPITSLNFPSAGARSVRGTYPLKWGGGATKALAVSGNAAPSSQTVSLRMNVATDDKKVIETASETIKVTCERAQPKRVESSEPRRVAPAPQRVAFQPMAIAAANPPAGDFDVRIRRVDREGPGGAVQLWMYNAGPDAAANCVIVARANSADELEPVAAVATIGPRQTIKLPNPLPDDASEFELQCPGEPQSAVANNRYVSKPIAQYQLEKAWPQKAE